MALTAGTRLGPYEILAAIGEGGMGPLSDTPSEVVFEMLPLSYIFKAGHRIRLTLFFADSSSPAAPATAPRVTIVRSRTTPSSVTLPVIPAAGTKAAVASARAVPAGR